jgi:hypothetical protein
VYEGWGQIVTPFEANIGREINKLACLSCRQFVDNLSKAAFGLTPSEYKELKGLERENLRDHMNDLELIFSMLGEAATTEITRKQDAQGFNQSKVAAHKGGRIAGEPRCQPRDSTSDRCSPRVLG